MVGDLETLIEIVEDFTRVKLRERTDRENETVFARALYFGLANELFTYSHRELAEKIGRKRLTAFHAINRIYPNLESYKPLYASVKASIVEELDARLGTKYADTYISRKFQDIINELNKMPQGSIDRVREKFLTIIRVENARIKSIEVNV